MNSRRPLSLRQIPFVGAGLAACCCLRWFLSYYQVVSKWDSEIEVRVQAPMQQYTGSSAHGLAAAIWNVDKAYAAELTRDVMRNPDLVSITVVDEYSTAFVQQEKPVAASGRLLREQRDIVHNGNRWAV